MALKQNDFNKGLSGATTDQFVRNKVLIESKNSLLIGKPLVQFHCTDIIQINTGVLQTKELTILLLIFQVFYHKN